MRVLIFGATGNCGRYCAKRFLDNGWTVFGVGRSDFSLSHPKMTFVRGDIRDKTLYELLPRDVDLVINFAGVQPSILPTSEKTDLDATLQSYVDVNISGVFNVLEFVRTNQIPAYVYTTSHRDYEEYWRNDRFLENDLPPAINYSGDHVMYAITKTSAKMIGDYYGNAFGVRVFNLRLPMIFLIPETPFYLSHGKPAMMPFLQIIREAMAGRPLQIWGDKDMVRDYVHIDNLMSLIELCYESDLNGGTFNVGTGEAVTTENFVRSIGTVFSPDPNNVVYEYFPDKRTYKCAIYNVDEQKEKLGYEPVLLDGMLRRLKQALEDGDCVRKWGW
ncbi:NAD(P)-dependent oxidoreductase [uncultured Roseobacter sp.]|uniref:NAD-dependent epimerase/dehydratase family protein n=1 Tax=uncultured Roseobacter sp. TaxID=114847 RepID=UPI002609DBAB|nr:NAD(P)-dependent oxidoreductase [uncultured Roseobacter sp.]